MGQEIAPLGRRRFVKTGVTHQLGSALAVAMIAAVAVVASGIAEPVSAAPPSGDYIVALEDGIDAKAFAAAADARSGVDVEQVYSVALRAFHAHLTGSATAQLAQEAGVRFVSPNRTFKASAQALPTGVDRIEGDLSTVYAAGSSVNTPVAVLDTGVTPDPDLNVQAIGQNCLGGVGWSDLNGHGTHTAGTIAAASNGVGIVGVAPNVKIAGIKAGNDDGFFFPEAVICAFWWAGSHGIDVTNNSYFADPWLFNCRNDAEQRAIWKAEQRAIRYAMQKGVTVVAAEGNENIDLSKQNTDTISPDTDPNPPPRDVTNACLVIPVEIPGVVGVTADGYNMQKAYYSTYGVGSADVVAPGGDRRFQIPPTGNGRVLSTVPGGWAYAQGTSMASPHAAGVAALAISQHGFMPPGAVEALLQTTADPLPCPANPFNPGPPFMTFPGSPRTTLLVIGAGVSVK